MTFYDVRFSVRRADETAPYTQLTNGMRWTPPDEDTDVELPPWSWLCPEPDRTVTR